MYAGQKVKRSKTVLYNYQRSAMGNFASVNMSMSYLKSTLKASNKALCRCRAIEMHGGQGTNHRNMQGRISKMMDQGWENKCIEYVYYIPNSWNLENKNDEGKKDQTNRIERVIYILYVITAWVHMSYSRACYLRFFSLITPASLMS